MNLNLPSSGLFIVAFSGGIDSLSLLSQMTEEEKKRSVAVYVNHGLREEEELEKEVRLNERNTQQLGIKFEVLELGRGVVEKRAREKSCGIEAAARFLRYQALEEYRRENGYDWILTAHHRDDQAETVMMRMLSSSPFWAWGGIRERDNHIIRPILRMTKEEIKESVTKAGLIWSEDSTNSDESYRRNWIRHRLLPHISENEKNVIANIALNIAELQSSPVVPTFRGRCLCSVPSSSFLSSFPWDKEKTIYMAMNGLGNDERITRGFISEIIRGAENGNKRAEKGSIKVRFSKETISFFSEPESFSVPYEGEKTLLPLGLKVSLKEANSLTLEIPESTLKGAVIRKNAEGDVIFLRDGRRKVNSLLKEHHIPYSLVLEKEGQIVAVFSTFLGGRDRLSSLFIGKKGIKVAILPNY